MTGIVVILAGILAFAAWARRERRWDAMRLPENGAVHYHDGPVFGATHETPDDALGYLNFRVRQLCSHRASQLRASLTGE